MNCTTYRNDILLAESGELASVRREAMLAHLESCPECDAFAKASSGLSELARVHLPQETPHPSVMVTIRSAAEARRPGALIWFPTHVVRWAACAAALALVAGSAWIAAVPHQRQASRVAALSTVVTMVTESTLDDDSATMMTVDDDRDLKAVARQLLEMEGFQVDDLFDDEVLSLFEEPAPTTTQWRRTPASLAQRCV